MSRYHSTPAAPLNDHFQLSGNFGFDTFARAIPDFSLPGKNMIDMVSLLSSANEFGVFADIIATPDVLEVLPGTDAELASKERETHSTSALNLALLCLVASGTRLIKRFILHPREDHFYGNATASYYFDDVTITLTGGQTTEPDNKSDFGFTQISGKNSQFRPDVSTTRKSIFLSNIYWYMFAVHSPQALEASA